MRAHLAAGLIVFALSTSAHADTYPLCDRTPSPDDVEAAKGMHKAAEQYYAKARYDRAITSWLDAYNFDCTAHRLLINIGNAYEKLSKTKQAIEAFEAYVDRAGPNADQTIVDKVANLKDQLMTASYPEDNGTQPPPLPNPDPTPDPNPDPGPDTPSDDGTGAGPWVVVGAGLALSVVGGVLLGVGLGKEADAEDQCLDGHDKCTPEAEELGNEGLKLQVAGGTVLAVGLVGAAAGVAWYLIGNDVFAPSSASNSTVKLDVAVSPQFTGLGLTGAF